MTSIFSMRRVRLEARRRQNRSIQKSKHKAMTLQDPCRAAIPNLHVLTLPGWQNSGPAHWQSRWETLYGDVRVEQHDWVWPLRGDWMMRLEEAVTDVIDASPAQDAAPPAFPASPPAIVLVAHSLGCQLVAAWAAHSSRASAVSAALLVAPPDVERADAHPQLHSFRPIVRERLPFPALAVISTDDPFCSVRRAAEMTAAWGADTLDAGPRGHLNADSGLGDWTAGRQGLAEFLARQKSAPSSRFPRAQ